MRRRNQDICNVIVPCQLTSKNDIKMLLRAGKLNKILHAVHKRIRFDIHNGKRRLRECARKG